MNIFRKATLAIAVIGLLAGSAFADESADKAAIQQLLMVTFDKPEARLTVDPVTVEGDVAVAGWTQGDMGGRALLRRKQGAWVLTLCSGDSLKDPKALESFGLPAAEAEALAAAVVAAEAHLNQARLAKLASFEGVVKMGADTPDAGVGGDQPANHGG